MSFFQVIHRNRCKHQILLRHCRVGFGHDQNMHPAFSSGTGIMPETLNGKGASLAKVRTKSRNIGRQNHQNQPSAQKCSPCAPLEQWQYEPAGWIPHCMRWEHPGWRNLAESHGKHWKAVEVAPSHLWCRNPNRTKWESPGPKCHSILRAPAELPVATVRDWACHGLLEFYGIQMDTVWCPVSWSRFSPHEYHFLHFLHFHVIYCPVTICDMWYVIDGLLMTNGQDCPQWSEKQTGSSWSMVAMVTCNVKSLQPREIVPICTPRCAKMCQEVPRCTKFDNICQFLLPIPTFSKCMVPLQGKTDEKLCIGIQTRLDPIRNEYWRIAFGDKIWIYFFSNLKSFLKSILNQLWWNVMKCDEMWWNVMN